MDNIWVQKDIENYSFYALAKDILPKTEYQIRTYPFPWEIQELGKEPGDLGVIPQFYYVSKEEEKSILSGTWSSNINYESELMPYGFYFINLPLIYIDTFFKSWFANEQVDALVKPYYTSSNGLVMYSRKLLATAVFIILHEYGHYLDYKKFGSTKKYYLWSYDAKKEFREYEKEIGMLSSTHELTEEHLKKRNEMYRQCKDENSADQYALRNLEQKVEEALNHIPNRKN